MKSQFSAHVSAALAVLVSFTGSSVRCAGTEAEQPTPLPDFAYIPAGVFAMGGDLHGRDDAPIHNVRVSAFNIHRTEVTKKVWDKVREWAAGNGYTDLPEGGGKAVNHPVHSVSWFDVVKWCNAKSQMENLTPCYYTNVSHSEVYRKGEIQLDDPMVDWNAEGYRLPTEAEWEKAARGGLSSKRFPWGNTISHERANFENDGDESYQNGTTGPHPIYKAGEEPYTSPVGSFAPNGYGLYDMAGNILEWCWDRYGDYGKGIRSDPRGVGDRAHTSRVFRGGFWGSDAACCSVAFRYYYNPDHRTEYRGFRLARSVTVQKGTTRPTAKSNYTAI